MSVDGGAVNANMSSVGDGDTSNITANVTATPEATLLSQAQTLIVPVQLILTAMTIIWIGSHASLRRPPSAAPPKSKDEDGDAKTKKSKPENIVEGLVASDAIMLPIFSGIVLAGLYYLIEWLQDPNILNKILRSYMSIMSVASLGKLSADALEFATGFVFPERWVDHRGRLFEIDPAYQAQYLADADLGSRQLAEKKHSPFAGFLSEALPRRFTRYFWKTRHLFTAEWQAQFALYGVGSVTQDIKLNNLLGVLVALQINLLYYVTGWAPLSNLLGAAFCYTALAVMSPTSFAIGTLVLIGLFAYDIVMVFYTPYMIKVATELDVPIKLVFKSAAGSSMLGLGDVVIPGIFVGLALRFDLYQHYRKKIRHLPVELVSEVSKGESGETTTVNESATTMVKEPFVDPRGQWGNRFWASSILRPPSPDSMAFSKSYFYASMTGYTVGMLVTMTILHIFKHGQPALLYLVPSVTGAVWLTGAVRKELQDLWTYTEDGTLDVEDVVVERDRDGNMVKKIEESKVDTVEGFAESSTEVGKKRGEPADYHVFLFSIKAPRYVQSKQD